MTMAAAPAIAVSPTAATVLPTEAAVVYPKLTAKGKERQVEEDNPVEIVGTFAV